MEQTTTHKERIFGLDLLRAFAIITVVVGHGNFLIESPRVKDLLNNIFGYDGVSIFFVLSGFLIGGILIKSLESGKKRGVNLLLDFWIRRWFRTIPNYMLVLVVIIVLNLLYTEGFSLGFKNTIHFFTFTQNLYYPHPEFFQEAWSISVEEWFYLLLPPLVFFFIIFLNQNNKMSIFLTAITIIAFAVIYRIHKYCNLPTNISDLGQIYDLGFRKQVITRLDSLMFGVFGAFLQFYYKSTWIKYKTILLLFGISLILVNKFYIDPAIEMRSAYKFVFSFLLQSLATFLLLPFLSEFRCSGKFILSRSC